MSARLIALSRINILIPPDHRQDDGQSPTCISWFVAKRRGSYAGTVRADQGFGSGNVSRRSALRAKLPGDRLVSMDFTKNAVALS